ncbi:MAG: helix-turn-helix domain-containing protein [Acidovorax sp.]|uniref:helix-turn-helix domain-containing protein n=1 Tax=Acidovorax sp. TaxID=1872122 RepID=UPI002605D22E|nr:helix-turn-helix domain-containing protein [Acidovorax sp.]MDH4417680.1 helix-turn-helix domain-containing protein [Acidovorax sp.]
MSTIMMAACWPLQMSATQKIVLVSLADQANDEGVCWPAVGTIAERTCVSERAVQDALKWLESHSALRRERRNQRSTVYIITPRSFTGKTAVTTHYVYRIEHVPSGRFYVGLRSSAGLPEEDDYWGSGVASVWLQKNKADCVRKVLATFPTRREAAEYEAWETQVCISDPLCMNKRVAAGDGGRQAAEALGANPAPANTATAAAAPAPSAPMGAASAPTSPQLPRFDPAAAAPGTVRETKEGTVTEPLQPASPPAVKVKAEQVDEKETALQAACRATWAAYSDAYERRYGAKPVRNASVNAKVKQFVLRIGHDESPAVAEFYVDRVSDSFVVRKVHDVGLLLSGAEGYRTQWTAGSAMTATRAAQADKSQANYDAAAEAMALIRAKRGAAHAG